MVSLDKVVINHTYENAAYREEAFVVNNLQLLAYYFVITALCVYKIYTYDKKTFTAAKMLTLLCTYTFSICRNIHLRTLDR